MTWYCGIHSKPTNRNPWVSYRPANSRGGSDPKHATRYVIKRPFEAAGIEFILANRDCPGVRLKEASGEMKQEVENRIRQLAYELWVAADRPEGCSLGFWKEAEKLIAAMDHPQPTSPATDAVDAMDRAIKKDRRK